jgi:hypothetical protein
MGPARTRTLFHHDLTRNFMARMIGRKRIKRVPLSDTPYKANPLHCYSQVEGVLIDDKRPPAMRNAQLIECTLASDE